MDDQDFRRAPTSQPAVVSPTRKRRVLSFGRIVTVLVLLAIAGAVAWIVLKPHSDPASPPGQGRAGRNRSGPGMAVPVAAAKVTTGDMPVVLNELGAVTPLATVTVKTQIAGQLQQIGFKEGQLVKTGDFLAQIDPRPYQVALEQAEGTLAKDQATLDNAHVDLNRYTKLYKEDSVAEQTLATQASLVHQLEGTVKSDQGVVDNAKLNLTYCHIVAPVAGRVGLRQVDQGNYVQTSDANGIVLITQLQPISVVFTLPEDNLPALMRRVNAGETLPVTAYDRTQTTKLAAGKLETVDNTIDPTTGTVKIRAVFDNTDNGLFPSQFINAALQLDVLHDAMLVPVAAIQRGAPGTFVYLVKPDNTVAVQVVSLGPGDAQNVSVTKGLEVGAQVVVDGADKLRDGAQVTLPEDKSGADGQGQQAADPNAPPAASGASGTPSGAGTDPGSGQQTHHHHRDRQGDGTQSSGDNTAGDSKPGQSPGQPQ
jgi:multidrug efflux system membrane fusion protein